jgi:hypothetical protein
MKMRNTLLTCLPVFAALAPLSAGAVITFETAEGYTAPVSFGPVNGSTVNAPFTGLNGWSASTSTSQGQVVATTGSGEYVGGQALTAGGTGTYIGGLRGGLQYTGVNSIAFDAQYATGIGVGFLGDYDGDGFFDQGSGGANGDPGLAFGVGGSPARFEARYASFGTELFNPANLQGTGGNWYHFNALIGDSLSGSREITLSVYNLTTSTLVDLNGAADGTDWKFNLTDAQFGVAPEAALGVFVRLTSAAKVDNLLLTVVPEPAAIQLFGLGLLALLHRRRA